MWIEVQKGSTDVVYVVLVYGAQVVCSFISRIGVGINTLGLHSKEDIFILVIEVLLVFDYD
jgi:hypothetical protein